jgi:hypothetical protein
VFSEASRYYVCAMKTDMLCFCYRVRLLVGAVGEVGLRDSFMELRKQVFV